MHDLGMLGEPGGASLGFGINDAGEVVGYLVNSSGNHAFLYTSGALHDLGTLGGRDSAAWAITSAGQVVGDSRGPGADPGLMGPVHAFLYDSRGMHDLGPLGGTESSARAINASGQIAGTTAVGSGSHAVMWDRGTVRDLGGLPGCPNTMATSINDSGQVVG